MKTCYLVGIGMGNPDTLTLAGQKAIAAAGQIVGAARMLAAFPDHPGARKALIRAEDIAKAVSDFPGDTAVLLSGDVGFYSGAAKLHALLKDVEVEAIPGISSLSYFCAKLCRSYQDVHVVSVHGREANVVGEIQSHKETFLLTGSNCTAAAVCQALTAAGLGKLEVAVGQRLSYPEERIVRGEAEALVDETFDDLAVMLVDNPAPLSWRCGAPSLFDSQLHRGKVPMTKEAVRTLAVARMEVAPEHTVWDVGAGTGSVSCALAMAAFRGQVYAVEREMDAVALIEENRASFGLSNLHVVLGEAPKALLALPKPDRVFVGGSGGEMEEIFRAALAKNPAVRFCLTAVSLESLTQGLRVFEGLGLQNVDVTQLTAAQAKVLGSYHMMLGQNPVYILSGEGQP